MPTNYGIMTTVVIPERWGQTVGDTSRLGEYILGLLDKHNLSMREASIRAGLSPAAVNMIVRRGKLTQPRPDTLQALASVLDGDFRYMMQLAGHLPSRNDDRNSRLQYRVDEIAAIWDRVDALDPDTADRLLAVVKAQGEMALLAIRASQRLNEGETDEAAEHVRHTDA